MSGAEHPGKQTNRFPSERRTTPSIPMRAAGAGSVGEADGMGGTRIVPADDEEDGQETPRSESDRRPRRRTAHKLTPEQRTLRARLGAYRLHTTHDPKETTRKAREAFASRFERQVDPDGVLAPAERARRAEAARRAHFTRLALRSSQARRRPV